MQTQTSAPFAGQCDYCDLEASVRIAGEDGDIWQCSRHTRSQDRDLIVGRWMGSHWQSVR